MVWDPQPYVRYYELTLHFNGNEPEPYAWEKEYTEQGQDWGNVPWVQFVDNELLIIGEYEEKSIMVDSINYQLLHLSDHNYYDDYFTEIGDTLSEVIREFVQDYEVRLSLEYPFKRLSLRRIALRAINTLGSVCRTGG